ncbi:MAG: cohesin domain-containing protein [Pseudomonadota bacterium]
MNRLTQLLWGSVLSAVLMASATAGTVVPTADDTTVAVGDNVIIDITGEAFSESLVGFGLTVSYDPSVLQFDSAHVPESPWNFVRVDSDEDGVTFAIGPGSTDSGFLATTSVIAGSFLGFINPAPTGEFAFATLTFTAIGVGQTDVSVTDANDPAFLFADTNAMLVTPTFGSDNVVVTPLPLPAVLFASAILAAGWVRRRVAD